LVSLISRPPPAIIANEVLDAVRLAEMLSGRVIELEGKTVGTRRISVLTEALATPNRTSPKGVNRE
jgi:hypothetical protein